MAEHETRASTDHQRVRAFARAGTHIHYWAAGPDDAPCVVLTHGVTLDHGTYAGQGPALLAAGYRVVTWDMRGHGLSQPMGDRFSIQSNPILESIEALGFGQRFALLGGLMFVYTHVACAAPSPDNVEGFVYLKPHLFDRSSFVRFQLEMVTYATLFGVAAAWLLF